jgi:gamma-glutamyltranspeptidase/glutathione hydrolase
MHPSLASAIEKSRGLLAADPGAEYIYLPQRPGAPYHIEPLLRLWKKLRDSQLSFYDEVARDVAELGYFEVEDFANYRPEVKEAIGVEYGGWTIYETPGFAVLLT